MVGDLVRALGYQLAGYVDRNADRLGTIVEPLGAAISYLEDDLLESLQNSRRYPEGIDAFALGIGDNRSREACLRSLEEFEVPALVHPSAFVSGSARLGYGTVVFPHAVVNTGARIDEAVIVNSGAIVEHDCVVGVAAHLSPGAVICGGVKVGARSWIGAGATVIHGVEVGTDAIVGAGSTVLDDVVDGATVVGSPARLTQQSRIEEGRTQLQ
jgi:sugar O-acyltransferase (sialic acid O-acetyltransferase NeuD family)